MTHSNELSATDFLPIHQETEPELIPRPSLSYWQDAWRRLKKNVRAIISLYLIAALAFFTLTGPIIWNVDPTLQDLNQISQAPSLPKKATLVANYSPWSAPVDPGFPAEPDEIVDEIDPVVAFRLAEVASTQAVRLLWEPLTDASGYNIYRNESKPEGFNDLGLPLASINAGNQIGYEDRLNLKAITYYYSIVPTDGFDEYNQYTSLKVEPMLTITVREALERNILETSQDAVTGSVITLEFHPFGTDYLGRDMLARLMQGARVSLFIGIVAPLLYVSIGIIYGGFAGYFGDRIDQFLMRFADFVVALPFLLFMILFKISFGIGPGESGILPMLLALVLLLWPATARLVRGQVLQIREQGYIEAARILGGKPGYLILRHIIPNTMGVILVTLTFAVPSAIFTEAFLSFIGMGVAPPTPSWGSMCNEGVKTMLSHPHELFFPALFISITVLAFNLLGDGLTEALDARMRSRE
ncbi:MAG: ABC transporter permease [Gammaproteobacteria bacterium]|nr:ABC transporter permease [Gammaproteobacteria bacterium]